MPFGLGFLRAIWDAITSLAGQQAAAAAVTSVLSSMPRSIQQEDALDKFEKYIAKTVEELDAISKQFLDRKTQLIAAAPLTEAIDDQPFQLALDSIQARQASLTLLQSLKSNITGLFLSTNATVSQLEKDYIAHVRSLEAHLDSQSKKFLAVDHADEAGLLRLEIDLCDDTVLLIAQMNALLTAINEVIEGKLSLQANGDKVLKLAESLVINYFFKLNVSLESNGVTVVERNAMDEAIKAREVDIEQLVSTFKGEIQRTLDAFDKPTLSPAASAADPVPTPADPVVPDVLPTDPDLREVSVGGGALKTAVVTKVGMFAKMEMPKAPAPKAPAPVSEVVAPAAPVNLSASVATLYAQPTSQPSVAITHDDLTASAAPVVTHTLAKVGLRSSGGM